MSFPSNEDRLGWTIALRYTALQYIVHSVQ